MRKKIALILVLFGVVANIVYAQTIQGTFESMYQYFSIQLMAV